MIAYVHDLPGCSSSAPTVAEAVARAPERITHYFERLAPHRGSLPVMAETPHVEVMETFHIGGTEEKWKINNVPFEGDRRALTYWDVVVALELLDNTRQDLLTVTAKITPAQMDAKIWEGESATMGQVLRHLAGGENWYFSLFELALDEAQLEVNPLERLATGAREYASTVAQAHRRCAGHGSKK